MRELRFRAWDNKSNNMINGYERTIWCQEHGINGDNLELIGEKLEVMQYIGLADKNGVEVYEGDIVKVEDNYSGIRFEGTVVFTDASFAIRNGYSTNYRWLDYDVEVVGNIYESSKRRENNG